jgi:hypothetical protein
MENTPPPQLVDNLSKQYLQNVLKQCNQTRTNMYVTMFNLIVLAILFIGGAITLYILYSSRPNKQQAYQKMMKDQDYVLSKIRFYQEQQKKISNVSSIIEDLPSTNLSEKIGYDIRDNLAFGGRPLPVDMPPPMTPHLYPV